MLHGERYEVSDETLRAAMDGFSASLWTSLPGIVQSFDATAMTVTVQPAIKARIRSARGVMSYVDLPLLVDVPVVFPGGGGYTLTFPIAAGDECLVVFADRCIDSWWQSGGVQHPAELRLHNLSDGFAIVGPRSQPNVLSGVSTSSTQLRSDSGALVVDLEEGNGQVTVTAPTKVVLNSPIIALNASTRIELNSPSITGGSSGASNAVFQGTVTATEDVIANSITTISLKDHVHSGVVTGGSNTGIPVP